MLRRRFFSRSTKKWMHLEEIIFKNMDLPLAVRRAVNRFRWWSRLRRRGTVSLEEHLSKSPESELSWNLASRAKSPEDALLLQEEREKVKRMLLELPLHQRIAVIMRI